MSEEQRRSWREKMESEIEQLKAQRKAQSITPEPEPQPTIERLAILEIPEPQPEIPPEPEPQPDQPKAARRNVKTLTLFRR